MSFKPKTKQPLDDNHLMKASDIDVIDRNQKWAQRREEKLQRLKQSVERQEQEQCSFQPKIVRSLNQQQKHSKIEEGSDDQQYYSSVFVKDGINNYFTRLEQARRMKKEAQSRLGRLVLTSRELGSRQIKERKEELSNQEQRKQQGK